MPLPILNWRPWARLKFSSGTAQKRNPLEPVDLGDQERLGENEPESGRKTPPISMRRLLAPKLIAPKVVTGFLDPLTTRTKTDHPNMGGESPF